MVQSNDFRIARSDYFVLWQFCVGAGHGDPIAAGLHDRWITCK